MRSKRDAAIYLRRTASVRNPKGQERPQGVPLGAAAPTDGKQVLSAAGSPEGSRPSGKVSPQGRWEFSQKLPYLVLQITDYNCNTALSASPSRFKGAWKREKGATRHGERSKIYAGRSLQSTAPQPAANRSFRQPGH